MPWDSDSEDEEQKQIASTITYILIAIDCDDKMFEKEENNEESTFKIVLRTCYQILDGWLMKGGKRGINPIAIALVSDDIEKMILCDFKDNLPTSVKKFRELTELSDEDLQMKYKREDTLQMNNFLLNCKQILRPIAREHRKYIAYITKQDNPIGDNENDRRLCVNIARDFRDFNIYLELLTFNQLFVFETFFQEIWDAANCKFSFEYFSGMVQLKEKLTSLFTLRGSRVVFYPFKDENNYFDMIEKRYIKQVKFLNNITVTRDTNEEVKEIKRGGSFRNTYSVSYSKNEDPIALTTQERDDLVSDDVRVGFTLLGTYNGDMIDVGVHSTDPKFIQRQRRENCPHFDIFWQYCVDKNSRLICTRKYKTDGPTKLVQLTPKLVNGIRSFLVLGIPFFDDIRYQKIHNPLYCQSTDNKSIMKAAEDLVEALNFRYNPLDIHDTVKCRKWEYIRSVLLEEKSRKVPDVVELDVIEKDVTDVVNAFKELTPITGVKRKAISKGKATKKK